MKIYNYSDEPVVIDGSTISDREIILPTNYDRNIVTHNGSMFLFNAKTTDSNVIYTITNHRSGNDGHYRIKTESFQTPPIYLYIGIFISFFSFFLLVRLIQKLKMN